jgi:CoA:oxalate CoA-transferase
MTAPRLGDHEAGPSDANRPLAGFTVLDLTRYVAGPACGRLLADLGADVIKVEPPEGDPTRAVEPVSDGTSHYFAQQNGGKRSLCVDLRVEGAPELIARLAGEADVFLENFRPGVLDRHGLDAPTLRARHPALVYCSITGYGHDGAWARRRAFAPLVHAEAGTLELAARKRRSATIPEVQSHGDVYPALLAANGILAALLLRGRTGNGQHLDVSMAQALVYTNEWSAVEVSGYADEQMFGAWHSPIGHLADGRAVAFAGNPVFTFPRWVAALAAPELLADERFTTVEARQVHRAALHELIDDFTRGFHSLEELEAALEPHNLPVGQVRSLQELAATPWAVDRGIFAEPAPGMRVPATPYTSHGSTVGLAGPAPRLGADNHEILRQLVGMSDGEIRELERRGALVAGSVPAAP